jgi:hypothetical protein
MKAFIDRIFRNKKLKEEAQIEENKRILKEQIETAIETKIEEAKEVIKKEEEVKEVFAKPGHYFADCNCFKCLRWRNQNAK